MFILLVFLVAYGVARHVILNPDETRGFITPVRVTMVPYFQLFGELFLDYPQDSRKSFREADFQTRFCYSRGKHNFVILIKIS